MNCKTIFTVISLLCVPLTIHPRQTAEHTIPLIVDFARFNAEGEWNYIDLYFSIPRDRLSFEEAEDGYEAHYVFGYEVMLDDSTVANDSWAGVDRVDSLEAVLSGQRINDQASLFLAPGSYRLNAVVKDVMRGGVGTYSTELDVKPYSGDHLQMSDIQLGLRISRQGEEDRFVKNGLRIIPNPQGMYTMSWPILYYYIEIYNLSPFGDADSTYSILARIEDGEQIIRQLAKKKSNRSSCSIVDAGSCLVSNLSSGTYSLVVDVVDEATADTVSKAKTFYVYRPSDFKPTERSLAEREGRSGPGFDTMSEGALDSLYQRFVYIVRDDERDVYFKLNLEGKRRFMAEFWKDHDLIPETPENETMIEYMQRVSYATAAFAWGKREGWRTDQGRVYIVYGPPDDILRFPNPASERPYQLWYYHHIDSGVEFVFVDRTGFGDMLLVHSTARNEVQDFDWMEKWLK